MTTDHAPDDLHTDDDTDRGPAVFMVVGGAIALLAAIVLLIEKVNYLTAKATGETTELNCDINPFISCGGVINTDQASAFGFPNPIIGVVGFSVVVTLGVLLLAGVVLPRWVWGGLGAGVVFGIGFVTWLQYQSIFEIQKLCPWCMLVWAMMIPLFVLVAGRSLRALAPRSAVTRFLTDWSVLVIALWYIALLAVIWFQFGSKLWS